LERIRLERLTKVYVQHPVVADFSLSVQAGEFCVILGPSGSGKSTLINMIAGFTPPTSGEIYVDGRPTSGLAPHERDLGMMFQGYALFPHLTVYENVAFPLRARGVADEALRPRVAEALAMVELAGFERRLPDELSGGQQQRTALARALVFGPRLLLMDEPLAALDRHLRERMQTEIRAIVRKLAITVLYITHDQQEAMTLADVLVVMNRGRAEQMGPPLDVYHRPKTRFVCEFLGDTNLFQAAVESVSDGLVSCLTASGERIVVQTLEPVVTGQQVTLAIRPERLRFALRGVSEGNRLVGRVDDVVDWGASRRYSIEIPRAERTLWVTESGGSQVPVPRRGDEAVLGFGVQDVIIVAA
jgi:ABC-type Fe3+/spermidine/putrescine transport system ATPase subunit